MILMVFSVYDKAAKAYMRPFYARSRGEAVRSLVDTCADEKHDFHRHAGDFTLYYHGEFDDNTGLFAGIDPERVISALECMPSDGPIREIKFG